MKYIKYMLVAIGVLGFGFSAYAYTYVTSTLAWGGVSQGQQSVTIYRLQDSDNQNTCYVSFYNGQYSTQPSTNCVHDATSTK